MNIKRRDLLLGMGATAGSVALTTLLTSTKVAAKVSVTEDFTGHPGRFGVLTDTTICVGCRICESACNRAMNLPPPEKPFEDPTVFEATRKLTPGAYTVVNRYTNPVQGGNPIYRKMQCMHCEEPACVSACLVAALKKTPEGPVIYDEKVCIGCRYCMNACPFRVPTFEYEDAFHPAIRKCVMCFDRLTKQNLPPACAAACPPKATLFGKREDLVEIARQRIYKNPGRYVNHIYGEHEVGGTGWLYLSAVPLENLGLPVNLGRTPYNEFTRDWLLAVPIVLIGWPALFLGLHTLAKRREQLALEAVKQPKVEKDKEAK